MSANIQAIKITPVKLYSLILDDVGKYHLAKLDVTKNAYVMIDHDLDLFALSRLFHQQDHDAYQSLKKQNK